MKNYSKLFSTLMVLLVTALQLQFTSCKEKGEEIEPLAVEIKAVTETPVSVESEGGDFYFDYEISNPQSDGMLLLKYDCEWLTDSIDEEGSMIKFSAQPNVEEESRTCTVQMIYTYADKNVSFKFDITQKGYVEILYPEIVPVDAVDMNVEAQGGSYTFRYTVNNPVDNGSIVCGNEVDWISNINTDEEGVLKFDVAANTEVSPRSAVLNVAYVYDGNQTSFDVNVIQQSESGDFILEVTNITASSADIKVTPNDMNMTFISMFVEESIVQDYVDDQEAWFYEDMNYFSQLAGMYSMSLVEYLQLGTLKQGVQQVKATALTPNTVHYLYAYGIDISTGSPVMTTDLYKVKFTTKDVQAVEDVYQIEATVNGSSIDMLVIPPDDNLYVYDCVPETSLSGYGSTIEEQIKNYEEEWIASMMIMFPIDKIGYTGPQSRTFTGRVPGVKYYACAFGIDNSGKACTEVFYEEVVVGGSSSVSPMRRGKLNK